MFLFLHSQEGKKCFHYRAKINLRIVGVFSAIQNKSSRAAVFTLSVFQRVSRRQRTSDFPQQTCPLAAALRRFAISTKESPVTPRHGDGARSAALGSVARYELRSICARNSAIEPNLTVPSGSLASIDPSV